MCIICISPKGVKQPTLDTVKTMFERNPHGAGYMTVRNDRVEIHKGFMNIDDLTAQLKRENFTTDDPVVYHFRISTQAGVNPAMTHPFPLTTKLKHCESLDLRCGVGIAHNGIIRMTSNNDPRYSDTALFITGYLTRLIRDPEDLRDNATLDMIQRLTTSKFALMDTTGYIATVGDFINEDGILYSNNTYKPTLGLVSSWKGWYNDGKDYKSLWSDYYCTNVHQKSVR